MDVPISIPITWRRPASPAQALPRRFKCEAPATGASADWENQPLRDTRRLEERRLRLRVQELERQLRRAQEQVERLRPQGPSDTIDLCAEFKAHPGDIGIIGRSARLQSCLAQARQVSGTASTVLLQGETGTGKELFATAIHKLSPRGRRAMVGVNCGAFPATLMESELFGRERGAYTGAVARQMGSFEQANGSTLFLDEVGELSLEMQAKLLRVLQDMTIQRLGSPARHKLDVRVIAASNRDLARLAREGRFRQDLYYRLNVFPIKVPPLRERREDIPLLVAAFMEQFTRSMGKHLQFISRQNLRALEAYPWPGNVRELRNAVERAAILVPGPTLQVQVPGTDSFSETHEPAWSL